MKITDFSVDRPITMVMIIIGLFVLGLTALSYLSVDLLPEITNPTLTVSANYPGAGPEEVENDVTRVIESGIGTVSNVEKITSNSSVGSCQVRVQFTWGTNMDTAMADVRSRLELVKRRLPDSVEDVVVFKFDTGMMPILALAVSGPDDQAALRKMVDDTIGPALEKIPGVAAVNIRGGTTREVQVQIEPGVLQKYGITVSQLMQTLQGENVDVAGGIIPGGDKNYVVRGLGRYKSVDELRSLPVSLPQGGSVTLGEIALVNDTFADVTSYTLLNGKPAISLSVQKQSGANTVDVAERVKKETKRLEQMLPGGVRFALGFDQSQTISDSIREVSRSIVLGGGLAIMVLLVFLRNIRTTVVIATTIPFAVITTFTLMYFNNMTLNLMTMGGISLGVGHMVDYSIVVLESIYRYRGNGYSAREAAKKGTDEVGTAVFASALTVAVVFMPMVFVQGLAGQLFKQFALTVACSQLAALFVALTLVPLLCSRMFEHMEKLGGGSRWGRLMQKSEQWYQSLDGGYRHTLNWSLKRRLLVVLVAAGITAASIFLIPLLGTEFMPQQDAGQFNIDVEMPVGTVLAETGAVMERVTGMVRQVPEVETVLTSVGGGQRQMGSAGTERGQVSVRLKEDHKRSTDEVINEIRRKTRGIPGATIRVSASSTMGMLSRAFSGRAIELTIKGDDLDTLKTLARQVKETVESVPGTHHVDHSMAAGRPELQLVMDREKIAHYGLTAAGLAPVIRIAGDGQVVSNIDEKGNLLNVRLILDPEARRDITSLGNLTVNSPGGARVPLTELTTFVEGEGPRSVERSDQSRIAYVYGDYTGRDLGSVVGEIQKKINSLPLPPGYSISMGGQRQDMSESFASLIPALLLAILLVYMVMAGQFESLLYPFVIMFSIPVSITGVVLSLILTGRAFSVPAFIGLIMMCGIVVNNAIVLIDYINTLKKTGLSRDQAIVTAGPVRLRPILMTALTTLFALVPLALGLGQGTEMQAPMATVVIGGLLVSTILTLIVVPVIYTIFDDLGQKLTTKYKTLISKNS